jgi:hypothetical protein
MGTTSVAPPPAEEQLPDSFLDRVIGIFISPGQAFKSIVARPDFIRPMMVAIVGSVALVEAMLGKIGAGRIIRQSLEASGKAAQMTPDQLDLAVHRVAPFTAVIMHVSGVLYIPIYLVALAAIGLFIANVIFGVSVDFRTVVSVVSYASLVLQLGVILGLVMVFFGDPAHFNPENVVPTTVGFFLNPRDTSKAIYVLASSFDVFRIWFIVLSSIGISAATGKKVGAAAILLSYFGLWVLYVAGRAGLAAAMS